ncbi:hypothetical protein CAPTEDRAFT_119417, partial [Capitella teleta]
FSLFYLLGTFHLLFYWGAFYFGGLYKFSLFYLLGTFHLLVYWGAFYFVVL